MMTLNLQFFGGRGSGGGKRPQEAAGSWGMDQVRRREKAKAREESGANMLQSGDKVPGSFVNDVLKKTVDKAVDKLKEPEKFKSSAVKVKGLTNDTVEIRIYQGSTKDGFSATLNTQGGGRFTSDGHKTFAEAKKAVDSLLEKYERNKTRFKRDKNAARELMREISK